MHVVQDAVDGRDHALRVRGEPALHGDHLVLVPVAALAREHRVHVFLQRAEVAHVDRAELDEDVLGHADLLQLDDGAEEAEVAVVVDLVPECFGVGEEADVAQPADERGVEPRLLDEVVERIAALRGEEALDAGPVGVQQGADRGEGEALGLELADPGEAVEVLGAVELVPAGPFGRLEQAFAGVVPDGVDGDTGLVGQLVDAPPGFGHVPDPPG